MNCVYSSTASAGILIFGCSAVCGIDAILSAGEVITGRDAWRRFYCLRARTVTAADVAVLPAASRATAVKVCDPLSFGDHTVEYGATVSSAPIFTPSTLNCTPTTPMLSEAVAAMVTAPETVLPDFGEVIVTVGATA